MTTQEERDAIEWEESWARYDAGRQVHAKAALDRILSQPGLSKNLGEMVGRIRGATCKHARV